jgi:hypothetical protein
VIRALALCLLLTACAASLSGCAQTPQGKSIETAQYADLASTGAAIAQGASEANPLGASLIVIKPLLGRYIETTDTTCKDLDTVVRYGNGITYAAVVNNLAVAASLSNPIAFGLVGGAIYAAWHPEEMDCNAPQEVQTLIAGFVEAYNAQDAEALALHFSEDAQTPTAAHRPHIEWVYQEMFAAHDYQIVEVDGPYHHRDRYAAWLRFNEGWVQWGFEAQGGLITVSDL